MNSNIEDYIDVLFEQADDDRRLAQPDFQEEFELDCKDRARDMQSVFNNKID